MANPKQAFVISSITREEIAHLCNDLIIGDNLVRGGHLVKGGHRVILSADSELLTDKRCAKLAADLAVCFKHDDDAAEYESNLISDFVKGLGYGPAAD